MKRRTFPLVFVPFDLMLFAATYLVLIQARPQRNDTTTSIQSEFPTPTLVAVSMLNADPGNQPLVGAIAMDRDGTMGQENPVDTITIAQLLMSNPPEQPGPETSIRLEP